MICPVFNCGKTTVLKFINKLAYETDLVGGTTTASIYQQLEETLGTLLIDEVEKLRLMNDQRMRQLFNIGHEKNGAIRRSVGGRSRKYGVFSPLALAANSPLPGELMSRSIAIFMLRANMRVKLERFNEDDPAFMIVRDAIQKWAARCTLSHDPEMPSGFYGRAADNWRPLLAIVDDLNRTMGIGSYRELARSAAVALTSQNQYENVNVLLLTHIRNAFQIHRVDRIITQRRKGDTEPKPELIETLVGLEGAPWAEWAGLDDTAVPHRLTPGDIGRLLSPFRIKSKTIWPTPRKPGDKSDSGYFASQFERVWAAFCPETDTPPQERKINHLHKFQAATPPATLRATTQLPREELHRDFLAAWAETIEAETIDRISALCGHP